MTPLSLAPLPSTSASGPEAAAIAAARAEFAVRLADTPELIREAYRLRYQVYCVERGFLEGFEGLESDGYDTHSKHVVLCRRSTGQVIGTVRLVLPVPARPLDSFPVQHVCDPSLLQHLPFKATGEVSRFAISKEWFGAHRSTAGFARLGLVQGLIRLSTDVGVTHWCVVMERSLLRLLQSTAIHFLPLGPLVDYHGLRQPAHIEVSKMLDRVCHERPLLWDYLTEGGSAHARGRIVNRSDFDRTLLQAA